jgi:hypothetical protein
MSHPRHRAHIPPVPSPRRGGLGRGEEAGTRSAITCGAPGAHHPSPNPSPWRGGGRKNYREGSVLLLVLVVVAILALGTNTYLELMQSEHRAVRVHGNAAQATRLAESGAEYLKAFLAQTPAQIQAEGGLVANSTAMQALLADDQADAFSRGRFTILAPAQVDGLYAGVRYGVEDEAAKLNLHTLLAEGVDGEARNRLLALPSMTPDVADAILDWLDTDLTPREFGAEDETYSNANPPYHTRNGPIASLDELLLVRGVTPELLYGLDQNRNYFIHAGEAPRGAMLEIDNADGSMNRGWSAYLTLSSVELVGGTPTAPLADLNGGDLQTLYNTLKTTLTDEQAKFIVLYRQYGSPSQSQDDDGENGRQGGDGAQQGQPPPGGGQPGGQPSGEAMSASEIELNYQQQGQTRINSALDLVGVQVTVPATPPEGSNNGGGNNGESGGDNNGDDDEEGNDDDNGGGEAGSPAGQGGEQAPPPKIVKSPWEANANAYRDLLKLYDVASVVSAGPVAGRININAATRPVLMSIPQMTTTIVDGIVRRREAEPNITLSVQRHSLWLLIENLVTLEQMKALERFITTRGDTFSGQAVGFFDAGPAVARGAFVVDRAGPTPKLRSWRDLSSWGPGFSPTLLGAMGETTRRSP